VKRGVRFFYVMGTLIVILTIWNALQTPWDKIHELNPDLEWTFLLSLIVSLSLGITEIAVGWLIGIHSKEVAPKRAVPTKRERREVSPYIIGVLIIVAALLVVTLIYLLLQMRI